MKFIASLISLTALAGSAAAAKQTTVTILEFGRGGTVHSAANNNNNAAATSITTTPAAMTSFWKAMHPSKNGKYSSHGYAGMSVVPDLFTKADMGVIVGLGGNVAEHLENMPTVMALLSGGGSNEDGVVGQVKISGHVTDSLIKGVTAPNAKAAAVVTDKDDFGRRLSSSSTAESLDAVSLQVMDSADAKEADDQLRRLIQRLKDESSAAIDKTFVVHLVVETIVPESVVSADRRRLNENEGQQNNQQHQNNQQNQNQQQNQNGQNQQQNGENGYTNYSYNYKSMYEIQTFNVITWTAVGLVVIVFMVMGAFIGMPLYPDTLLFGFSTKMGSD